MFRLGEARMVSSSVRPRLQDRTFPHQLCLAFQSPLLIVNLWASTGFLLTELWVLMGGILIGRLLNLGCSGSQFGGFSFRFLWWRDCLLLFSGGEMVVVVRDWWNAKFDSK